MTTTHDLAADLTRRAKRRVDLKLGFLTHLTVFLCVNLGFVLLRGLGGGPLQALPGPHWGWALGLAIHGVMTLLALTGEGLRERWMAGELQRLQGARPLR